MTSTPKESSCSEEYAQYAAAINLARRLAALPGLDISRIFQSIQQADPNKFIYLLHFFATHHHSDLQQVRTHLLAANFQAAKHHIHSLKGAVEILGLPRISAQLKDLNQALRGNIELALCIALTEQCDLELAPLIKQILSLTDSAFDTV